MPKIIVKKKAEVLAEHPLLATSAVCKIGSGAGNDFVVADKAVSLSHLHIERRGARYFVRDLKSAFGTFVNGAKIETMTELHDGDAISLGDHTLVFRHQPGFEGAAPHAGEDKTGSGYEIKEAVIDVVPPETAAANGGEFAGEPSDAERLRRLQLDEVELDSLERELAEVLEQEASPAGAAPEKEAPPAPGFEAGKSPYYLLAIHGPYLGKKFQLNFGETKIGREARLNDIVIRTTRTGEVDPSISRRHATISYRHNSFYLSDKRSKSRTYLNQDRLRETDELLLAPGDEIEIVSDRCSTIFRFVAEGNWDFSFPRRTGAWWLRYRSQALALASIAVTLLGLITAVYAWYHRGIAADAPARLELQHHSFAKVSAGGEEEAGAENHPALAEYAPLPVLLHLNKDAYTDLAFIHADGTLSAMSGKTRRRLWRMSTIVLDRNYPLAAADLNGNGKTDLVAITADGHLAAIDGGHGAEIWTSPFLGTELIGPVVVGNFDGDGRPDVAVASVPGKLMIGYARRQDPEWVEIDTGVVGQAPLSCADLDGDGDEEILIGTERGLVLIYDGNERRLAGNVNLNVSLNKLRGRFDESNQIRHPVSAADLNGDGRPDLVVSSRQGNIVCLDLGTQTADGAIRARELWWNNLAAEADSLRDFSYPFALGDIDADGLADVIAVNAHGAIFAFRGSGRDGQRQPALWHAPGTGAVVQLPALFDFEQDGRVEVIAATNNGWIKILSGRTGEALAQQREAIPAPRETPLLADLSDKAAVDIVMVSADGMVHTFRSNRNVPARTIIWGQRYGSAANVSALAVTKFNTGKWTAAMLVSAVAIITMNGVNFGLRYRRRRLAQN